MKIEEAIEIYESFDSKLSRENLLKISVLSGVVAIASATQDEVDLKLYEESAFVGWIEQAVGRSRRTEYLKEHGNQHALFYALLDTMPEPDA